MRLTAPGIGGECGCTLGQNRLLYQGLFLAPHTVAQAVKTAVFGARMMELLGYRAEPASNEVRHDIIQMIHFGEPERLKKFCRGIQKGAPVDSYVVPEPWDMPGYDCPVIMAAGAFIQGASIELSADAPMREPYTIYLQGGLSYESGKAGILLAVEELLKDGFSAVFLGSGAGLPNFMGILGETLCGVFSANEWLTRINLMHAAEPGAATPLMLAKHVVVVGGGNVAMDAARCALRCGAEVTIVYRRGREELPARAEEVEHAEEEGITFRLLTNPVEILGDENGFVTGIRCDTMALGEPDESGRRRPEVVPGAQFTLDCDAVIMAIGTTPNPLLHRTTAGLAADRRGRRTTEEGSCRTSLPGVFAGGDAVTGAATVILAMGAGRRAAQEIDEYLRKNPSH